MVYVSEIQNNMPEIFKSGLQKKVYHTLSKLQIPYVRVDTDEVITMEDCASVNEPSVIEV